jgi:small GTP-binding protein
MTVPKEIIKKVCVIGEAAVGKTSLIRRFVYDRFDDRYISTLGTKTTAKELQITLGEEVCNLKLQIWDVLGSRSFAKIQKNTYKGSNGAFIVLDLTRKETMYTFGNWLLSLYKAAGQIPVVVLANKNDLKPEYDKEEIESLLRVYDFKYFLTSAKTGENVNNAFDARGKMMIKPWTGLTIGTWLGSPETLGEVEVEMEADRKFTALEAEDIIMARFCDLLEDTDIAMAMMREQFKRANVNFMNPTIEGLARVIDYLINAASSHVEPDRLKKEEKAFLNLIKRIA